MEYTFFDYVLFYCFISNLLATFWSWKIRQICVLALLLCISDTINQWFEWIYDWFHSPWIQSDTGHVMAMKRVCRAESLIGRRGRGGLTCSVCLHHSEELIVLIMGLPPAIMAAAGQGWQVDTSRDAKLVSSMPWDRKSAKADIKYLVREHAQVTSNLVQWINEGDRLRLLIVSKLFVILWKMWMLDRHEMGFVSNSSNSIGYSGSITTSKMRTLG